MTTETSDLRCAPNHEENTRPLSHYDNLTASLNEHSSRRHLIPIMNGQQQQQQQQPPYNNILFKFHDSQQANESDRSNNITNESNNNDNDRNDKNDDVATPHRRGHMHVANNNNNNNNNNSSNSNDSTPVTSDKYSESDQYKHINDSLKVHRNKVISDAKSSFFGLNTETPMSDLSSPLIRNNNLNQYDRVQLVPGANDSNKRYQNLPSNSECFNDLNKEYGDENDPNRNNCLISGPIREDHNLEMTINANATDPLVLQNNLSPSQILYMTTTVPPNIRGSNIMGRHKPTRNSLRHSRMIVINKNYQESLGRNPLDLSRPCLTKLTLVFQVTIGVCITFLALWILLWAPNTRIRDNPYWSGLVITLAGIVGLILIEFKRIPRHRLREQIFKFIRLNSIVVTTIAVILSFASIFFSSIHLTNLTLSTTSCFPANILTVDTTCVCLFYGNSTNNIEIKTADEGEISAGGFEFQYKDLSCTEVKTGWTYILIISTALNLLGFVLSLTFLLLISCRRKVN